jgi:uncharacterized RmlC-like cupin family protein
MTAGAPGEVIIIRAGGSYDGKQGMTLAAGVSSGSAGARGLCLHLVTIPPGTRGVPHVHDGHESAIYTVSGETEVCLPGVAFRAGRDATPGSHGRRDGSGGFVVPAFRRGSKF